MNKFFVAVALGAGSLLYSGCKDDYTICDTSVYVAVNGGFFDAATGIGKQPASFSITNSTGGPILTNITGRSTFSFPLQDGPVTSSVIVTIAPAAMPDTLTFTYNTTEQVISPNCGNIIVHTLTSVSTTKHTLDSVAIKVPLVSNVLAQNIEVFY